MRKLDLTSEGAAIAMGILEDIGRAGLQPDVLPGSIGAFGICVPDDSPELTRKIWVCQPIKFIPHERSIGYRCIAQCSVCGENVWKDKRAIPDAIVQCHNCAIADMLDCLGIDIEVVEDMIPAFGSG
jgi:hypothetical protein